MDLSKKQSSSSIYKLPDNLQFTEKEIELFDFLLTFVKKNNLNLELRCVGGFVRDKLLGLESQDIDIALDKMTGEEFVLKLKEEYAKEGNHLSGIHIIKQNPEKSKHLQTATCQILNFEIDFVNLRGEEYAQNSRIPSQTSFGSPKEDALRRDLTINALFYNINKGELEDFTERGYKDLKKQICMTPLDPLKTFIDDPLRVLRTFRFSTRYKFKIDDKVIETIKKKQVKDALKEKVSSERMGKELQKIVSGEGYSQGIKNMYDCNLWSCLFAVNPKFKDLAENKELKKQVHAQAYQMFTTIDSILESEIYVENEFLKKDHNIIIFYACALTSYFPYKLYDKNKPNKYDLLVSDLIVNFHRLLKGDHRIILQIIKGIYQVKQNVMDNDMEENKFIKCVKWIKDCQEYWKLVIKMSKIYFCKIQKQEEPLQESLFDDYQNYIIENNLQESYNLKPLLKGEEIAELFDFNLKKVGPLIRTVLWNINIWQAENILDQNKQELINLIKEDKSIFLIDNLCIL